MSISSINSAASNAYMAQAKAKQAPVMDKPVEPKQAQPTMPEPLKTDKAEEDSSVKSFAYGALGMDKPNEVEENEDGAYTAGQVLKAIGTVGSIIAIMV
ncbi:hypothetical protein [Agarivorans sp. 1_MG-2023]|uniref:hypothetical protein n=1 Tax=Agarivorans sp. 1_MG-2023 TaxID=3062634 RepID=UPI0026E19216|nr:hypothetical protein [Agarivorans sp. 1_MG-2023]MDO6765163.1 hypothetical protein [Agarivorans sp. 1_MG-2023]